MKKILSSLILIVILLLVISACAAPKAPSPATTPSAGKPTAQEQRLIEAVKKAGEKEVIWWTVASIDAKTVIAPFEAKYPFLKVNQKVVFPSQGATRVIEEAKAGMTSVDLVFWTDPAMVNLLAAGLLAENEWPGTEKWKGQPGHNFWRGIGVNAWTAALINTRTLPKDQWPKTMDDLKNPKYKGKVVASTSRETVILETAWFWRKGNELDWDRATKYWTEVITNTKPSVTSGFEAPMERFAAGEFDLFLSAPLGNTFELIWKGSPVTPLPAEKVGGYNFPIGILKNAPHPNAAKLLANYLTSEGLVPLLDNRGILANSPEAAKVAKANRQLTSLGSSVEVMDIRFITPELIKKSGDIFHRLLGVR